MSSPGALPNLVVIGAMKAGTTALHHYLGRHPDIAMSAHKELNFFYGPMDRRCADEAAGRRAGSCPCRHRWVAGNWHRGVEWYSRHFDAGAKLRGESSPSYTSPSFPAVAERMAGLIPGARLLYLVRDPIARALSQYQHHRRDATERRPLHEALLDPGSQYISRGRYFDRLTPFLRHFERRQIFVVAQEELLNERRATLRSIFRFLQVDDTFWAPAFDELWNCGPAPVTLTDRTVRSRLCEALHDDAEKLRKHVGRSFPAWSV